MKTGTFLAEQEYRVRFEWVVIDVFDRVRSDGKYLWQKSLLDTCIVWPSGRKPNYRFHIQCLDMDIFIAAK
ncbi:hypothetical protein JD969_17865 [Planctomycetota bacterium]|nr:hypothetical protein JD969_17865 [Planctomycetota bacterium]